GRWDRWRPTLSLCQHDDFLPSRVEILIQPHHRVGAQALANDITSTSPETEVRLQHLPLRDPWDFAEVYAQLRDFVDGYDFREDEDYLVHMTTGTHVAQICLFLLVETRHIPGRLIQSSPPISSSRRNRRSSSAGTYTIIDLDLSRYDRLAARFEEQQQEDTSFLKGGIETQSPAFNALIDRIEVVATHSTEPILLTGATGAGKTRLARRIYELKKRQASGGETIGALVEVNCATLRGDAAMSTLFGHEKGAFTGAVSRREGVLQSADGGLLFLDEIGELGLDEQAMLLHAIEDGTFTPVGSDRPKHSRFQLIAGTNRDLHAAVRAGTFRDDLLARIDLWSFRLPQLAQRREDLEPNLDYELARCEQNTGRRIEFSGAGRKRFLKFAMDPRTPWHANFRDLAAAVTRMTTLAGYGRIHEELVDQEIENLQAGWRRHAPEEEGTNFAADQSLLEEILGAEAQELDRFDAVQLAEVLRTCREQTNLAAAGRTLFAQSRAKKASRNDSDRLRKYLARFDLSWADLQPAVPK
ncbi:MAG: RNA repair transcriptional activator RtcR, partial [Planctomycetota bacterium]